MKIDLLNQTLERAFVALGSMSEQEVRQLSTTDQAFTLDVLPACTQLANIRVQLAEALRQHLSPAWISEGDLFEVFLVLAVLWRYDPLQFSGEHLAYAIQRLVQSEVRVGGPYACDGVVDLAANLKIASFVQMVAKPLPGLDAFFNQVIKRREFENTTFDSPYILYLLTKLYHRPEVTYLAASHRLETPAYRAVALTTIKHSASIPQQELLEIYSHQQPTGFWPAETLLDGRLESDIATTALIVKSLIACLGDDNLVKTPPDLKQRHQLITEVTKQLFQTRAEPLRQSVLAAVDKICSVEGAFEITLLSYFFARALKDPVRLTDQQLAMLGAASVCGWIAYTIYDDFLDDEGTPSQLPVANITMRASLDCFRAAFPEHRAFERYVGDVFNEMDEANAWEIDNCRFTVRDNTIAIARLPRYGRQSVLAARSFAHALGPIAILNHYAKSTSQQTHHIESAFRHYLIARQLSDDLHDWVNDIQAGQGSYVVIAILRDMRLQHGTYSLPALLSDMHKQFRHTTLPRVCELALRHIGKSKEGFAKSDLLQPSNKLYSLLDELELSLYSWLDQHSKAQALVTTQVSYSS